MTCDRWLEPISAAADGELHDADLAGLEDHLTTCPSCQGLLDRFTTLRRRLLVGQPQVPSAVDERALVQRGMEMRARRTLVRRASAVSAVAASAAVAMGLLASGEVPARPTPRRERAAAVARPDQVITTTDDRFSDPDLTVDAGASVEWLNNSGTEHHLVRQIGGTTLSADLEPGQAEVVTFDEPGVYPYSCTIHDGMDGRVVVHS